MPASFFLSASALNLTSHEHDALIRVLGMLERGELKYIPYQCTFRGLRGELFNMNRWWSNECDTAGCIGGWAEHLSPGIDFGQNIHGRTWLRDLFFPNLSFSRHVSTITPAQAAIALRSYLTTGKAQWSNAIAPLGDVV